MRMHAADKISMQQRIADPRSTVHHVSACTGTYDR